MNDITNVSRETSRVLHGVLGMRDVTMGMLPIPCPHPAGRDLFGHLGPPCCFSEREGFKAPPVLGDTYSFGVQKVYLFLIQKGLLGNTHALVKSSKTSLFPFTLFMQFSTEAKDSFSPAITLQVNRTSDGFPLGFLFATR